MRIESKVRAIPKIIEGTIIDTEWNKAKECLQHMVKYVVDGEEHVRWFFEHELEELEGKPETEVVPVEPVVVDQGAAQ